MGAVLVSYSFPGALGVAKGQTQNQPSEVSKPPYPAKVRTFIPAILHSTDMGQSSWRGQDKAGTCNTTLSGKEFLAHKAALSYAIGDNHSLDTTSPPIPGLIYHQSDERKYNFGTISLLTTN